VWAIGIAASVGMLGGLAGLVTGIVLAVQAGEARRIAARRDRARRLLDRLLEVDVSASGDGAALSLRGSF
jgi:hypothetical protein